MEKLLDGVIKFKNDYFQEHKHIFEDLASSQNPHTLFIGCSDSRVIPNLISSTLPGELFVVRNIANMVPPYSEDDYSFRCTASAIEYAVKVLEVENILVCGHSNCGGCKALYQDDKLKDLKFVKKWVSLGENIKNRVLAKNLASKSEIEFQTEQLNIVAQLDNLMTYPCIKERIQNKKLNLIGWYYIIETGDVFNYNFENQTFELIS